MVPYYFCSLKNYWRWNKGTWYPLVKFLRSFFATIASTLCYPLFSSSQLQAHYSGSWFFAGAIFMVVVVVAFIIEEVPQHSSPGSNTITLSRTVSLSHSLSTLLDHVASSAHIVDEVTPLGVDPVVSPELKRNFFFNLPSRTLSDIFLEGDLFCCVLNKTRTKLCNVHKGASNFELQKNMFIEIIQTLQSKLKEVKTGRNCLKIIVSQQADSLASDRKQSKSSCTVLGVSMGNVDVAEKVLSKLHVCCSKEASRLCSFSDNSQHGWASCSVVATDFKISTLSCSVALYHGYFVLWSSRHYTRSFPNYLDILKHIVRRDVENPAKMKTFPLYSDKNSSVNSVTSDRRLQANMRQLLLNEHSARKRKARATVFERLALIVCAWGMPRTPMISCGQKEGISSKQKRTSS